MSTKVETGPGADQLPAVFDFFLSFLNISIEAFGVQLI